RTVYELPHGFTVSDPTFLPSALPGPTMTPGNRVELLENGDAFFPAMLAAISSARKSVNFEAYIFWSGEVGSGFREALVEGDADSREHWRDTQVRVEGPAVRGLQRAFQENWSEVTGEPLVGDEFFPALPQTGSSSVAVVPSSPLAAMSGAERVYAISLAAAA